MIIDKIENSKNYTKIHPDFSKVFEFIANNNLFTIENGKYTISGENVFAVVMEYTTQEVSKCKTESHKKYIDIQYMIHGEEEIGFTTLHNQVPITPYNDDGDYMFYNVENLDILTLKENHFTIFFEDDIHQTMRQIVRPKKLKKVVFKILK
ncbi:MAG: YhcH/YjgK/YiaL family protein [Flavicella sp.]